MLIHKADDVPAPRIIRPNEMTGTCVQGSILVLLSRELEGVYRSLEKGTGTLARWRLAREATKLRTRHAFVLEFSRDFDFGDRTGYLFHSQVGYQ